LVEYTLCLFRRIMLCRKYRASIWVAFMQGTIPCFYALQQRIPLPACRRGHEDNILGILGNVLRLW
jgi:hypothetical protein